MCMFHLNSLHDGGYRNTAQIGVTVFWQHIASHKLFLCLDNMLQQGFTSSFYPTYAVLTDMQPLVNT